MNVVIVIVIVALLLGVPVFQHTTCSGEGHRYSPAPMPHPPAQGEDPVQMDIAAEHCGAINLMMT